MSIKKTRDFQITLGLTCKILCTIPAPFIHPTLIGLFGKEICEDAKMTEADITECYFQIPPVIRIPFFNDIEKLIMSSTETQQTSRLFFLSFFPQQTIKRLFSDSLSPELIACVVKLNNGVNRNKGNSRVIFLEWISELVKWEYEDRFKIMKAVCRLPCYFKQGLESRIYLGFTFMNEQWRDKYWELLRPIVRTTKLPSIFKGARHDIAMFVEVLKEEIRIEQIPDAIVKSTLRSFTCILKLSENYTTMDKWCMFLASQTPFFDNIQLVFRWYLTTKQLGILKMNLSGSYHLLTPHTYIKEIINKY